MIDGLVVVSSFAVAALVTPGAVDVDGACPDQVPDGDACFEWNQDAYVVDGPAFVVFALVGTALLILAFVVLRRLTGTTPGRSLLDIRVVDGQGRPAGFGRSAVRTTALAVDLLTVVLPIGLWLALFTPGHRRVGDYLAGTYVVRRDAVGRPPGQTA